MTSYQTKGHRHKNAKTGLWLTDTVKDSVEVPEPPTPVVPVLPDLSIYALKTDLQLVAETNDAQDEELLSFAARLKVVEDWMKSQTTTPPPPPPPPSLIKVVASAYVDTKDNDQVRLNGNGNFAILLRKKGTGPLTGVRLQTRYGTSSQVYHKGDGGLYQISVHLGSPDSTPIAAKTSWKPGVLSADAHFPEIMFDQPSPVVDDGTRFYLRGVNIHLDPDHNYLSINALLDRDHSSPRQPSFGDDELAIYLNTGSGWKLWQYHTPMIDMLPSHEGFGYSGCLTQYWQPIGGPASGKNSSNVTVSRGAASGNRVRQSFHLDSAFTFDTVETRLRRVAGTGPVLYEIKRKSDSLVVWSGLANSAIAPSSAGDDVGGYGLFRCKTALIGSAFDLIAGDYYLELSASGNTFTMTPARKAIGGYDITPATAWKSYTADGAAEFSYGTGLWSSFYGSPNETDIQFAIYKAA